MDWTANALLEQKLVKSEIINAANCCSWRRHTRTWQEDVAQDVVAKILERVGNSSEPVDKDLKAFDEMTLDEAVNLLVDGKVIRRWTANIAQQYGRKQSRQSELMENLDLPAMPDESKIRLWDAACGLRNLLDHFDATETEARVLGRELLKNESPESIDQVEKILKIEQESCRNPEKCQSVNDRKTISRFRAKIAKLPKSRVLSLLFMLLLALLIYWTAMPQKTKLARHQPDSFHSIIAGHQKADALALIAHQDERSIAGHQDEGSLTTIAGHQKADALALVAHQDERPIAGRQNEGSLTTIAGHQKADALALVAHQDERPIAGHQDEGSLTIIAGHQKADALALVAHQDERPIAGRQDEGSLTIIAGHQKADALALVADQDERSIAGQDVTHHIIVSGKQRSVGSSFDSERRCSNDPQIGSEA